MDFDFDAFNELVNAAGKTLTATDKAAQTFKSIQGFFKKSEAAGNADLKMALSELAEEIADAKLANVDLKLQLAALQESVRKVNDFQTDIARYELHETQAGLVVYRLKLSEADNQPLHYLCPTCVANGVKSILQGGSEIKYCMTCDDAYRIEMAHRLRR